MQLGVEWRDREELHLYKRAFKALGSDATKTAMMHAVNRAGDSGLKGRGPSVIKTLTKQTGLHKKLITRAVKPIHASQRTLAFRLVAKGGDISLKYFQAKETKRGVTTKVRGSKELHDGAFQRGGRWPNRVEARRLNGHVFKRKGSGRLPLEKLKSGVVLPDEMTSGDTLAGWNSIVDVVLPKRMMHELGRISGGVFS